MNTTDAQQRRGADAGSPDSNRQAGAWTDGRAPADPLDTYAEELAAVVYCIGVDRRYGYNDARSHLPVLLGATHDVARALHEQGHP